MIRVLKTFLLWFLIAALPIQGIAAVVQASCGPRHHDMASMAMESGDHHHDAGVGPHHHDNVEVAKAVISDTDQSDKAEASSTPSPKLGSCSACASCCFGAVAPPPAISLTPVFNSVETAVLPPVIAFTGFIPANLERPPRHLSA